MARQSIAEISARGAVPIVVGGSALYVRAIIDRFDFPGTDPAVRSQLEADLDASVRHRCTTGWPLSILPPPPESCRTTAAASSGPWRSSSSPAGPSPPSCRIRSTRCPKCVQIGLDIDRTDPRRADRAAGGTDVAGGFRRGGRTGSPNEVSAPGAPPRGPSVTGRCWTFLAGEISEQEAHRRTVQATRRFARRQDSWFRQDPTDQLAPLRPARSGPRRAGAAAEAWEDDVRAGMVVRQGTRHGERLRARRRPGEHAARQSAPGEEHLRSPGRDRRRRPAAGGAGQARRRLGRRRRPLVHGLPQRDGSIAEMCGNGIRLFARYLVDEGLAYGPVRAHRDPGRRAGGRVAAGRPDPGRHGPGGRLTRARTDRDRRRAPTTTPSRSMSAIRTPSASPTTWPRWICRPHRTIRTTPSPTE